MSKLGFVSFVSLIAALGCTASTGAPEDDKFLGIDDNECWYDFNCESGEVCAPVLGYFGTEVERYRWLCTAPVEVGGWCDDPSDCAAGEAITCLRTDESAEAGKCAENRTESGSARQCFTNGDCSAGYVCRPESPADANFCLPRAGEGDYCDYNPLSLWDDGDCAEGLTCRNVNGSNVGECRR